MTQIGATPDPMFRYYIDRWRLKADGNPIVTPTSRLLPVRWHGVAAILKIAVETEEELGNELMVWWDAELCNLVPLYIRKMVKSARTGCAVPRHMPIIAKGPHLSAHGRERNEPP